MLAGMVVGAALAAGSPYLDLMAAYEIDRYIPFQLYLDCREHRPAVKSELTGSEIFAIDLSGKFLAASTNTLQAGLDRDKMELQGRAMKAAFGANCRLSEFWQDFEKGAFEPMCPGVVAQYRSLVEAYRQSVYTLAGLGVIIARQVNLVMRPIEDIDAVKTWQEYCDLHKKDAPKTK